MQPIQSFSGNLFQDFFFKESLVSKLFPALAHVRKLKTADQFNAIQGQKCGCEKSKNNGRQTKRDLFTD